MVLYIKVAISHLFPAVRSVIIPSDAFLTNKQGFPAGARACCGCDGLGFPWVFYMTGWW